MKYKESKRKIDKIWVTVNKSKQDIDNLQKQFVQPHNIQYAKRISQYEFPRDLSDTEKADRGIYYKEFVNEDGNKDCWYIWHERDYFFLKIRLSNIPEGLVSAITQSLVLKVAPESSEDFVDYLDYRYGQFSHWYNVQKLTDEQLTEDEDSAYILEVGFRKLFSWNDQGYGNTSRFGNLYFKFIITINNPLKIYET